VKHEDKVLGHQRGTLFLLALFLMHGGCDRAPVEPERSVAEIDAPNVPDQIDPHLVVTTTGHGAFWTGEGRRVVPGKAEIRATQFDQIKRLLERAGASSVDWSTTPAFDGDDILRRSFYIERLIAATDARGGAAMYQVNGALRDRYLGTLLASRESDLTRPWPSAQPSRRAGPRTRRQRLAITSSGAEYIQDCRDAGVPVPDVILDGAWTRQGTLQTDFVALPDTTAELWSYESGLEEPDGVCLALPRWKVDDVAAAFGVICLGRQSGASCYWDNPMGESFPRYQPVDIENFVGGTDLVGNMGGVCSDCHAGRNPFVVHPDGPAFKHLRVTDQVDLNPVTWHDPLVDGAWPQNPPPIRELGPVSNAFAGYPQQSCNNCHTGRVAGRFPPVRRKPTGEMSDYCNVVIRNAIPDNIIDGPPLDIDPLTDSWTMPPAGNIPEHFAQNADWLWRECDGAFDAGTTTSNIPNPDVTLSPPRVVRPLYACTEGVAVDVMRGADVTVTVAGTEYLIEDAEHSRIDLGVPPLEEGQAVSARQVYQGAETQSDTAYVRSYRDDYPDGLPAPEIGPVTVYECAYTIGVSGVPRAKVEASADGTSGPETTTSPYGYAVAEAPGQITLNQELTATQRLCKDVSPPSAPVRSRQAPSVMPKPVMDEVYGKSTVHVTSWLEGAQGNISERSVGQLATIDSWPWNSYRTNIEYALGREIMAGDEFTATGGLPSPCAVQEQSDPTVAKDCSELGAPEIATPMPGDDFVLVIEAASDAVIDVWANGDHVGEGMGNVIMLSRALNSGETVLARQSVGECHSSSGYQVQVQGEATPFVHH